MSLALTFSQEQKSITRRDNLKSIRLASTALATSTHPYGNTCIEVCGAGASAGSLRMP